MSFEQAITPPTDKRELLTPLERFDDLFERIKARPESGGEAVRFFLFNSSTESQETGKPLYSPSITAFLTGESGHLHIKRRELEYTPSGKSEEERKAQAIAKLGEVDLLFSQTEPTINSE